MPDITAGGLIINAVVFLGIVIGIPFLLRTILKSQQSTCQQWISTLLLLTMMAACSQGGNDNNAPKEASEVKSESGRGIIPAGPFKLRYQIEGTGTPAIVIGSSVYLPRAFSINLRNHLRMVFLDHRGYAPSPGPVDISEFAIDKLLDDVERARQKLGLGRIIIMGHSIHSIMALEYAKKYPDNVSHVVMIGAPLLIPEERSLIEQHWEEFASSERKVIMEEKLRNLPDEELAQLPPGQQFVKSYIRNSPLTWYNPKFDASSLWEGVESNDDFERALSQGKVIHDYEITQGLDHFKRPVFLALGLYDFRVAPPSAWDEVIPKFHNITVKIFERSGHWPHYEQPDFFDTEMLSWMKDHK
jgi:proline iminopeptidase